MLEQVLEVVKKVLPLVIAGIVLMLVYENRYGKSCNCNSSATATDTTVDPANVTLTK
jgi:hypothetical protein